MHKNIGAAIIRQDEAKPAICVEELHPASWHFYFPFIRSSPPRPWSRATEQRDELPPVLPIERLAHLGTAECCIHPPGRNEMSAITPPKIFSKEVAQTRPPHFSPEPPSAPEIVSDQISGDGAWMKI